VTVTRARQALAAVGRGGGSGVETVPGLQAPTPTDIARRRLILVVRAILLLLAITLTLVGHRDPADIAVLLLLVVVAAAASMPLGNEVLQRWQPTAEAVIACLLMLALDPLPEALLPYLLAPALAAGLVAGFRGGVTTSGLAVLTLVLGRAAGGGAQTWTSYLGTVSQWGLITLAVGLLGGWVQHLQTTQEVPENAAYGAAYRLLSQLRMVSRQLSGGLDPVTLAQGLLEHVRRSVSFDRAAVYVRSNGGRLTPIAFEGGERLDWQLEGPLFDEAWAASALVRRDSALTEGTEGFSAVIPLQIGLRTFGLVAMERTEPAFEPDQLKAASAVVEVQALRLETALLFSEVRTLATAEERRRLAREIHDGIAQELASLGYVVDDLADRARFIPDLQHDLKALRGEISRVISELRHSIFDLRSEVQSTTGLGTALSDYVRQVGAGSDLTVHLVLDETPIRLPIDAETELLRIAQEAITNARKHANAQHLWVTCQVDPPRATLRVEDDGDGLGVPRPDSFGLEVMRERAQRIGAQLTVTNREGGGTAVSVTIGPARVSG
jgi:signal transduction histidine kinase